MAEELPYLCCYHDRRFLTNCPDCVAIEAAKKPPIPLFSKDRSPLVWDGPWADVEHQMQELDWYASRRTALATVSPGGKEWADLLADDLRELRELIDTARRSSGETGCEHPLGRLFYHGFVSGRVGDYRCDQCQKVVHLPSLDAREWTAAREEFKAASVKTPEQGPL